MSEAVKVVTETFAHLSASEQASAIDRIYEIWTSASESRRSTKAIDNVSAKSSLPTPFAHQIHSTAARLGITLPSDGQKLQAWQVDRMLQKSGRGPLSTEDRIYFKTMLARGGYID
jgi:hypothetical protein